MTIQELTRSTERSTSTLTEQVSLPAPDVPSPVSEIRRGVLVLTRPALSAQWWGWALVAVQALFFASVLVEPAPANPESSLLEEILGFGALTIFIVGYGWGMTQAFKGDRRGLRWTLPVTGLMLVMAVSCPVSGHHAWGLWVAGSFGAAAAAVGVHIAALRLSRPSRTPDEPTAL
jgi:hypothetical protein